MSSWGWKWLTAVAFLVGPATMLRPNADWQPHGWIRDRPSFQGRGVGYWRWTTKRLKITASDEDLLGTHLPDGSYWVEFVWADTPFERVYQWLGRVAGCPGLPTVSIYSLGFDPAALPVLEALVTDSDATVRAFAAVELAALGINAPEYADTAIALLERLRGDSAQLPRPTYSGPGRSITVGDLAEQGLRDVENVRRLRKHTKNGG